MAYNYNYGQRLVIELINNQVFEGDCAKCGKDRINIINAFEYPKCNELKGVFSFYRSEIVSVEVLKPKGQIESKEVPSSNEAPTSSSASKIISLAQDEYHRLTDMTTNYIYLELKNDKYFEAVKELQECQSIAVFAIGNSLNRRNGISLLVLSSWLQVYIFDLLLFSEEDFPLELKNIMESDEIIKILHDSRPLYDCLLQSYKIELKNIFDTHVLNMILQKQQPEFEQLQPEHLSECLERYLNFPTTILKPATEITLEEWKERPMDNLYKKYAAQFVAYLHTLKNKQKEFLFKPNQGIVEMYTKELITSDSFEACQILNSGDNISEKIQNHLKTLQSLNSENFEGCEFLNSAGNVSQEILNRLYEK